MNDKLNLVDLVDLLVNRSGIKQADANEFVKAFWSTIEEALISDGSVKIKGLGTFKLVEVDSRESINVQTGERFEIQSHTKISFIPDASMRNVINKPFAHFESVILNEGTHFDDMQEDEIGQPSMEEDDGVLIGEDGSYNVMTGTEKKDTEIMSDELDEKCSSATAANEITAVPTVEKGDSTVEDNNLLLGNDEVTVLPEYPTKAVLENDMAAEPAQNTVQNEAEVVPEVMEVEDKAVVNEASISFGESEHVSDTIDSEMGNATEASDELEMADESIKNQHHPCEDPDGTSDQKESVDSTEKGEKQLPSDPGEEEHKSVTTTEGLNVDLPGKSNDNRMDLDNTVSKKNVLKSKRFRILSGVAILIIGILIGNFTTWLVFVNRQLKSMSSVEPQEHRVTALVDSVAQMADSLHQHVVPNTKNDEVEVSSTVSVDTKTDKFQKVTQMGNNTKTKQKGAGDGPKRKKEKQSVKTMVKETLADTVEYEMTGTLSTDTIRLGDTLAKIAYKFYGNRKLWPYIVIYNKKTIKNPDNVPIGTVILVPELKAK